MLLWYLTKQMILYMNDCNCHKDACDAEPYMTMMLLSLPAQVIPSSASHGSFLSLPVMSGMKVGWLDGMGFVVSPPWLHSNPITILTENKEDLL